MKQKQNQQLQRQMRKGRETYEQESTYEWLTPLLDAYQIADADISVSRTRKEKTSDKPIACQEGCYHCCLNPTVPINQFELMGLSFYVSEVLERETRETVKQQLQNHKDTTACPFLVYGRCSVYPLRPLACRMFYVYETPCAVGEDPIDTRPEAIARLYTKDGTWMVAQKLLPLFGIADKKEQRKAFDDGFLFKNTRPMHTLDWTIVARDMSTFE